MQIESILIWPIRFDWRMIKILWEKEKMLVYKMFRIVVNWLYGILTPFSTLCQLYHGGQCPYPCFPGVFFFNQYSTQYTFKITGCFPIQPLSKQQTVVREEWILSQWLSSILEKNIGQAGDQTSNLLFSSLQRYWLKYGLGSGLLKVRIVL